MKPVVAFITGGYSSEAVISYKSAITIEKHLDSTKFEVYRIDITREGWFHTREGVCHPVDRDGFTLSIDGKKISFDAVFIGIHGTPGEDGKLQGYFDLMGLPYTSCDAATSAITFNKRYTVAIAAFAGILTSRSVHLFRHLPADVPGILSQLQLPLFVKPSNGGSSIGMSKVENAEELPEAIAKAYKEDDQVLIEEYLPGREFTVGVYAHSGELTVLPITEIVTKKAFFDFEAKYQPGLSEEFTPADITADMQHKITQTARKVYQVFNCRGVVRMDFIYHQQQQEPYLLEINTVPGQSEMSIIPQQVRAMGGNLKDFYSSLIEDALKRRQE